MPLSVGVPLSVITLENQAAVTPAGKPDETPIPVAPVVEWEIAVNAVLTQRVGVDDATLTVLGGITIDLWQEFKKHNATNIKMNFNKIVFIFINLACQLICWHIDSM